MMYDLRVLEYDWRSIAKLTGYADAHSAEVQFGKKIDKALDRFRAYHKSRLKPPGVANEILMTESNQSVSAKQVRDVVALGKKYSKTAFPNPTREGCPNSSTLRAMAYRDRRLSLEDLPVSHVVSCSPCFQEYARLRRMSVLMRGIQVTAASLVVLAVLFAAARFVWNYTRGRGEPSISQEHRAEPQPRVATQQAPAAYCSACDDCRLGFLLPDPRR